MGSPTAVERGFLAGSIVGEGHLGVDRGRARFCLGLHVRHEHVLRRVRVPPPRAIPCGADHRQGRTFFRLMVRGAALRSLLDSFDSLEIDRSCRHAAARYLASRATAETTRVAAPRRGEPPVS